MDWIKITEQVPDSEVLALGYQKEMIVGYIHKDINGYYADNEDTILRKVTHWMPLPEPPKSDENKETT